MYHFGQVQLVRAHQLALHYMVHVASTFVEDSLLELLVRLIHLLFLRLQPKIIMFMGVKDALLFITAIILTLRLLMSYIYIYMEHPFLMFLDHTRRTTVGRTPLDE